MAENSKIEWTDHTFNPWIGCTKVSPACDGCYAENLMANRYGRVEWGAGEDRQRTGTANWRKPLTWNKQAEGAVRRPYVFCASLADVFDNEVDEMWRADLFNLIAATPNLIWLLLTKRIGNVMKMTDPMRGNPMLPINAAIGATMANQPEYDRDRMKLWEVRETLHPLFTFGSLEPLLGRVALDKYAPDWIITGGETDQGSHRARDTDPDDFRYLRDQSRELGRAFFMKQMTRKGPIPPDLLIRQWPIPRDSAWTEWHGGDMPVAPGTPVEVRLRYGKETFTRAGSGYANRWTHGGPQNGHDDILAYRLADHSSISERGRE